MYSIVDVSLSFEFATIFYNETRVQGTGMVLKVSSKRSFLLFYGKCRNHRLFLKIKS